MADGLRSFRIALGALCAVDLLAWSCDARPWLTDHGVVPRSSLDGVAAWPWRWSILRLLGSVGPVRLVLVVGILAAVAVALGRARRTSALVLVVVLASVHARAPFALSGADLALGVLAVWWLVLVWCEPYLLARRIALAAARLQVAVIYAVPLARRVTGGAGTWWRGEALERVLVLRSVTRPFPADALARLPSTVLRIGTWSVLVVESALVLVVVTVALAGLRGASWRPPGSGVVLWSGVALHGAMAAVLRLGLFPLVLPVGYLLLARRSDGTTPAPGRRVAGRPVAAVAALSVGVAGASVLAASVAQVVRPDADPTRQVWSPVLAATGLWQRWDLFSPEVASTDRWVRTELGDPDGGWRPLGPSGPDRAAGPASLRRRKLGDNVRNDPALARSVLRHTCATVPGRSLRLVQRRSDGSATVLASLRCPTTRHGALPFPNVGA